ncbi:unnamed protein product [marine sediment metagenome]|uniref:RNA polymerase sigma-70 region 2 domain-containing protein n=1 Tax=marine sediment metagenome TaxID=412755 RepID=X1SKX8_9ZZZZ
MEANPQVTENMKLAAKIFEEYGDVIRGTVCCNVSDRSMIDDILQDFFLALVRKPIPSDIQNVKSYLRRAVKNDILEKALQTKSYRARNQKYAELYTDRLKWDTPEDIVIQTEEIQRLFDIVESRLMPHEAEAVIQHYRYDRDTGEAAKATGINKRSFSHYLCTGLKKIRKFACENELEPNACF